MIDGVTLVVGSMAPDMAYALTGSRFRLWAHAMPELVWFCVPVTLLVSWLIVRVLAPVVPAHLPDAGELRLRELRGLSTHRFRPLPAVVGAFVGAASHVILDSFTHDWGWFARNVSWYGDRIVDGTWLGREWTVYRVIQYVGHVGGSRLCIGLLWRYGRQRWMTDRAMQLGEAVTSVRSHVALWTCAATGTAAGLAWIGLDRTGVASDTLRLAGCAFTGLCLGAIAARRRQPTVVTPTR